MLSRLLLACLPLLAACASSPDAPGLLTPYRIDVRQGNYLTPEMVARLKPGMTRDQVRFALGTPLVADIFHADRWDYVYRFQPGRGEAQQRRLTVFFAEDKLARFADHDAMATTAAAAPQPTARVIDVPSVPKKD